MIHSVLVLCTGNSCRSQMAEAYFRKLTEEHWKCESAGTHPTGYVHPLAITVMGEDAIDIAAHKSKSMSAFETEDWDYVVTVCDDAADTCPVFAGAEQVLHWPFPDPADTSGSREEQLTAFRDTRDAIKRQVVEFLREFKVD
ncbi:MAG: arsenate reductase ArsC [Pirellulaceae bacterium]|nr:arsenate reductase ArsC [Pirellulaceae bacterium]